MRRGLSYIHTGDGFERTVGELTLEEFKIPLDTDRSDHPKPENSPNFGWIFQTAIHGNPFYIFVLEQNAAALNTSEQKDTQEQIAFAIADRGEPYIFTPYHSENGDSAPLEYAGLSWPVAVSQASTHRDCQVIEIAPDDMSSPHPSVRGFCGFRNPEPSIYALR